MGLDMYLYRKHYVKSWNFQEPNNPKVTATDRHGKPIPLKNPTYILDEVAYWRKANAIHRYFCSLDGDRDECQEIYVSRESLERLRDLVEKEIRALPGERGQELPPAGGFFFGDTDASSDWYAENMQQTLDMLTEILSDDSDTDYVYQASW